MSSDKKTANKKNDRVGKFQTRSFDASSNNTELKNRSASSEYFLNGK